jgi:tetratricopeptide (TPR) repeat protein
MAPEIVAGRPADARSDIFSFCVSLYEALYGERPFAGTTLPAMARAVDRGEVREPPPGGDVPAWLRRAVLRGTRARPEERPASMDAFLAQIERGDDGRRRRMRAALASIAIGALLIGVVGMRGRFQPPGPVRVAVADFENQTGEPDLDGLSGMLITSLEQSRHLGVVTRVRMADLLRQAGHAQVARIDELLGREVAKKAGAKALLVASVRRFDQVYSVDLRALDPAANEYLFTLAEKGTGKGSLPELIDRLSEQTRERLREQPSEVKHSRVKVADAITPSLEAYQHYFLGSEHMNHNRWDAAETEFRRAIDVDPRFPLAHYRIAQIRAFFGAPLSEQRAVLAPAVQLAEQLPARERGLVLAWKHHVDGDDEAAIGEYGRLASSFPEDKEIFYRAGDMLAARGDCEGAVPWLRRAAALDPGLMAAVDPFVTCLGATGRLDELRTMSEQWFRADPSPEMHLHLASALAWQGNLDGAVSAARRAYENGGGTWAREQLALALEFAGRTREAEVEYRALVAPDQPIRTRRWAQIRFATMLASTGRMREARRAVDELLELMPEPGPYAARCRCVRVEFALNGDHSTLREDIDALVRLDPELGADFAAEVAYLGETERAEALAQHLRPGTPAERLYRAVVAWRSGRLEEALPALKDLARRHRTGGFLGKVDPYFYAEALFDAGRDAEAVEAFRDFRGIFMRSTWRGWALPRSRLLAARSLDRLGRKSEALRELDALFAAWEGADPGLPLLAEAGALRARLALEEAR